MWRIWREVASASGLVTVSPSCVQFLSTASQRSCVHLAAASRAGSVDSVICSLCPTSRLTGPLLGHISRLQGRSFGSVSSRGSLTFSALRLRTTRAALALSGSASVRRESSRIPRKTVPPVRHESTAVQQPLASGAASKPTVLGEDDQLPLPDYSPPEEQSDTFNGLKSEFPCVTNSKDTGPEPTYQQVITGFKLYHHDQPFHLKHRKGVLPSLDVAYETFGQLNERRDNAVLILTGLSGSSHAKSHEENPASGWWENFIGPGGAIDTSKYFVICANHLGGCYGSTGPSSINHLTGKEYGTTFPIIVVEDMVRVQFLLLDHLGIDKLHASVGSSLGGMMSVTSAVLYPERVGRVVSISACAHSHPSSIAMRYLQRKAIMTDPNWQRGHFYGTGKYPKMGMKLAREIGTITYRSGPEWAERFGRKTIDEEEPSLCPYFLIENYLDYQGEAFSTKLDPNTLLYISKAMDLFDLGDIFGSLNKACSRVKCPVMVIGVQTDILFPVWQQRELAQALREGGNQSVTYYELHSLYGHDTFLLDLNGVGTGVKGFLDTTLG